METLLAQVVNGIMVGSVYALLVVGLNLMLLVAGVFQYALHLWL
jgi:branched-subunit amino acid ABC-type transport system permease component